MEPRLQLKVAARRQEADDIISLELVSADGLLLPEFTAGAHIDVHGPGGLVRQYSLCNSPADRAKYLIGVLREPDSRGGSRWLHDQVAIADTVSASHPKNHFELAPHAPAGSLLLAGGIGVTPVLAMAEHLAHAGERFEFHYCARSRSRMAFVPRIAASPYAGVVRFHHDDGPPGQLFDAAATLQAQPAGTHLYVCGPAGFMNHVLDTARRLGWPEAHLHREYFAAAPIDHAQDGAFELELRSSGRIIPVAAGESAAQALAAHGVSIAVSCEQGVCGTCLTRVLEGVPDHKDLYLTDEEHARNDCFTPCCSRALSKRLVLDL